MPSKKKDGLKIEVAERDIPADNLSFMDKELGCDRHFVRSDNSSDQVNFVEVTTPAIALRPLNRSRQYEFSNMSSFIEYVGLHGDPEKGIIFYGEYGLTMFFDEQKRVEFCFVKLEPSLELKAFLNDGAGKSWYGQKDFVKTLEAFPECLTSNSELLPAVRHMKMDTAVEFEGNVDPREYVFTYKESAGLQTAKLPKVLKLNMPYFEDSEHCGEIVTSLEIETPKSAEEKVHFKLTDPRHKQTRRDATEREIAGAKKLLKGWLFVKGQHTTQD